MSSTTSNTEHLSLDGPISPWVAVTIALGLLAILSWSLMRESQVLGRRQAILFWVLRATALGIAIWMLLAPTKMLVEVSTTRTSVAIIADISGSMQTVDPAGSADDTRWMLMQSGTAATSLTRAGDSAIAAAVIAEQHLQAASTALAQHQRESLVVDATSAAREALERVRGHVSLLLEGMTDSGAVDAESKAVARRISKDLASAEFVAFNELCEALKKQRTPTDRGWRESLSDLQIRIGTMRRQLAELSKIAESLESNPMNQSQPQSLTQLQRLPRLGRVADLLGVLESGVFKEIAKKADIRVSTFDQSPRALTLIAGDLPETTGAVASASTDSKSASGPMRKSLQTFLPTSTQDNDDGEIENTTGETNLSAVLEQLDRDRREQPIAAAILLTDASHNSIGAVNPRVAAEALKGLPVYVLPIGNTQYVRDVLIQSVFTPTVAMRNDDIVIEAVIQAHDCEGDNCVVQLLQNDAVIETRTIPLDSGYATRRVRFDQKLSEVGLQRFSVQVSPLDRELSELNNRSDFEVNVTRSEIKILLADEMPRWEFHYLKRLFQRDPKVELDELLFHPRLIATGRRRETKAFPTTVDAWDQYDVVILGDLTVEHLPFEAQNSLIEYLRERGGTAIVIAGKEAMPQAFSELPLAGVLPVTRLADDVAARGSEYSFFVTEVGRQHNALRIADTEEATQTAWDFVSQFAPLHEVSPWRLPRPSATTLISAVPKGTLDEAQAAATSSLLCWQPVGRGRMIYFSGPETYRLRFLRGDQLHYRFWGQLLRWSLASELAAGSEVIRIRSDKSQYAASESVQITVRLADGTGNPVETASELKAIARSGDEEHSVVLVADDKIPGQYAGVFRSLPPGEYAVEPIGDAITQAHPGSTGPAPSSSFSVRPNLSMELLDTRSDRGLAQQLADITGGQVISPTSVEEVLKLINLEPEVTQRLETRPLWVEWKYLWIIFGCLLTEWIARKLKGLS